MRPNIGYFPVSDYLVLACSHVFQNILQGGDSMSHPGHGDKLSKGWTKVSEVLCCDSSLWLASCHRDPALQWDTSSGKANCLHLLSSLNGPSCAGRFGEFSSGSPSVGLHFGNIAAKTTRQLLHMSDSLGRQLSWLWVQHKDQNRCIERWWWKLAHTLSFLYMSWQDVAWRNHLCPGSLLLPQSQD